MEFEDDAFVLSARLHGETGAIVEILTGMHGRYAAHVAGGASRRMKPALQPGARVIFTYRARVSDQLGSARQEAVGEGPSALFDESMALAKRVAAYPPEAVREIKALMRAAQDDAVGDARARENEAYGRLRREAMHTRLTLEQAAASMLASPRKQTG